MFNRPDTTRQVFEAIRVARPPRLYVAGDGPRPEREGEAQRCEQARSIATAVDWPCEVRTLFQQSNLGCKLAVTKAIDWLFEHETRGIVLEDDILPAAGFFAYCDALLEKYEDEFRVGAISGCNFVADRYRAPASYLFAQYNHGWGWASWRRAWRTMDLQMHHWPAWDRSGGLRRHLDGDLCAADYWRTVFRRIYLGKEPSAWDYQWMLTLWRQNALTIFPACNLVSNLGFGADATNTCKGMPAFVRRNPAGELTFPLRHPAVIERDVTADHLIRRYVTGLTPWRCLKRMPRRLSPTAWRPD